MPIARQCLSRVDALEYEAAKVSGGRQCHFVDSINIADYATPAWVTGVREDERTLDAV